MQPPETEPTTDPSSASAMMEPTVRGDEPQVRTTVASGARWPAARQSRSVRSTITSRFSIRLSSPSEPVRAVHARQPGAAGRGLEESPIPLVHDHRASVGPVGDVVDPDELAEGPAARDLF